MLLLEVVQLFSALLLLEVVPTLSYCVTATVAGDPSGYPAQITLLNFTEDNVQGVFFTGTPPTKLEYGKPRLGVSTLT